MIAAKGNFKKTDRPICKAVKVLQAGWSVFSWFYQAWSEDTASNLQ